MVRDNIKPSHSNAVLFLIFNTNKNRNQPFPYLS